MDVEYEVVAQDVGREHGDERPEVAAAVLRQHDPAPVSEPGAICGRLQPALLRGLVGRDQQVEVRDRPHEVGQQLLEHIDVEGMDHDDDARGRALSQGDGAELDHTRLGIAGPVEADGPPLCASAAQVMQQRVETGIVHVGIVAEIPNPVEQGSGIQPARGALAEVVSRSLIRRQVGEVCRPIPLRVEQVGAFNQLQCRRVGEGADRPLLRASVVQVMQERVLTRSGDVGVVGKIPRPVEQRAGAQTVRRAFLQVMAHGLVQRHAGCLSRPIPVRIEQIRGCDPCHQCRISDRAYHPPFRTSAIQIVQQRIQPRSGDVGVVGKIPRPIEQRAGAQTVRRAFLQVMAHGLVQRHIGRLVCLIPLRVEQI